jgi:hypothetical protein
MDVRKECAQDNIHKLPRWRQYISGLKIGVLLHAAALVGAGWHDTAWGETESEKYLKTVCYSRARASEQHTFGV